MKKFKIAVFVSGNGSNLQALIDVSKNLSCPYKIELVFSNKPDVYALKRASQNNIPTLTLDHKNFKTRQEFDSTLSNNLKKIDFDLIVLAGFMRILGKEFIKGYENKIINLHPSLLPKYPGLNTHEKVLENKDKFHGATVHMVDEGLDTGKIIGFSKFKVENYDNYDSLLAKTHEIEHKLLPQICSLIATKKIILDKENILINGQSNQKNKEIIF